MKSHLIRLQHTYPFYQFCKFILVGVLNTIFGYSTFAICIFFGLHYSLATLVMTVLGILFNFLTVGSIVFQNTRKSLILRFCLVYGVLYGLGTIFIGIIDHTLNNLYLSGAINALAMPPIAFYLNKRFVFE